MFKEFRIDDIATLKYGKMPKKEILREEGFPVYSGYRITGYASEYLYEDSMVIVVARGVGGTGDVLSGLVAGFMARGLKLGKTNPEEKE